MVCDGCCMGELNSPLPLVCNEGLMVPRLQRGLTPKGFTLLIPLTLFALTQKSKQKKSRLWSLSGVEVRPSHSKNLRAKS